MVLRARHKLTALVVAVALHASILIVLNPPDDIGTQHTGRAGIEVSLAPVEVGSEPEEVLLEEAESKPDPEISPPRPEAPKAEDGPELAEAPEDEVTPEVEDVPDDDPVEETAEAEPQAEPEKPEQIADAVPPPSPAPVVSSEPNVPPPASKPARPEPPPSAEPTRAERPTVPTLRTAESSPDKPRDEVPEAPAVDMVASANGATSARIEEAEGEEAERGGEPAKIPHDYLGKLRAWLEMHKEYPYRAKRRRQQGTAVLHFTVDREGRVSSYRIVESSGHRMLDDEVEALIERAQPLPELPPEVMHASLELVVPIQFSLR